MKAYGEVRQRTAEYLFVIRLKQLREQAAARTDAASAAPWSGRLPGLAARPLEGARPGR
ncbi:hypothetical protein [Streptomyces monomycini]|uniref:hypothetical protein n=1 Tax=Streptomyces monomycini TaxID=371720 RepID=UPI000A3EDD33|nr:hypothetical protein [Streptomyces monomycini]